MVLLILPVLLVDLAVVVVKTQDLDQVQEIRHQYHHHKVMLVEAVEPAQVAVVVEQPEQV